jgi:hypothetical protein
MEVNNLYDVYRQKQIRIQWGERGGHGRGLTTDIKQ